MPNRLADETSPYLLQHRDNPVDWYPWGEEALARAAAEDRPILLSVGYSACHWCHVMERESFEDQATAELMNRHFVNVKVDREERPDIDEIYMKAVQAFTGGNGGWPMTVFLTPTGEPFLGGTYFPPEPSRGMPSFRQLLEHAARVYQQQREEVAQTGRSVVEHIAANSRLPAPAPRLDPGWLERHAEACARDFDPVHAGFGESPKFPPHASLAALLAHWRLFGDADSLRMATETLDHMALGGMYDLAGGGFARYSVDREWRIPHFEKMLYDNAQLVPVYVDAYLITGRADYRRVACRTLDHMLRELAQPEGGISSAQDADSEGEEGRFYVWTPRQLVEVLGPADGGRAAALFQVTEAGSFEHGSSVLRLTVPWRELDDDDVRFAERVLPLLRQARESRVWPGLDDKVICAWNALAVGALARAGAALARPDYLDAAKRTAAFLLDELIVDGRLHRTWKAGQARLPGVLDDHAFLIDGLVDLYEASFELRWLRAALLLAERMQALFWDPEDGGFFFTGSDAERLVARSKKPVGGAEPSGNGVAAKALLRLEALTGRRELGDRAEQVLRSLQPVLERAPRALGPELIAAAWRIGPTEEVGIVGEADDPRTHALVAELRRQYQPFRVVALVPPGELPAELPWMADRGLLDGAPSAWLCRAHACQAPVSDPEALAAMLAASSEPREPAAPVRPPAPALPSSPERWLNTDTPLGPAELEGQVVVLDFWTHCCINCLHVLPELAALEAELAGLPVRFIGVHSAKFSAEKSPRNVTAAIARHGVAHPVLLDPDHQVWQAFEVRSWPTVVVVDASGGVAWRKAGEVRRDELREVIQRLLAEAAPAEQGEAAPTIRTPATRAPGLHFPGRVHVFPSAAEQAGGAKALAEGGRLYVSDTGGHRILEAALERGADGWPAARVLRVFGSGVAGRSDGVGAAASFHAPQGLSRSGEVLWVADTGNHLLRRVDLSTGQVQTVAGSGALGGGALGDIDDPLSLALRSPWDVAAAEDMVFVAMAGTHQLWAWLPDAQRMGPVAGSGDEALRDGPAQRAALAQPSGLSLFGPYLFFVDSESSSVRVFDLRQRQVGTLVGTGLFDFGHVDGAGQQARLQHPADLALVGAELWIADTYNDCLRVLDPGTLELRTVQPVGDTGLWQPGGLDALDEFVVIADTNAHRLCALRREDGELRPLPVDFDR